MTANALISVIDDEKNDYLYKQLCYKLATYGGNVAYANNRETEKEIAKIVHKREVYTEYQELLRSTFNLILKYRAKLTTEGGVSINMASKRFKITDFDKRFRPFLQNVYIIDSKFLNKNKSNGVEELLTRLKNGKCLIFDEDMNSGATLKLSIDALLDKMPTQNVSNIKCLVNCYSSGGR